MKLQYLPYSLALKEPFGTAHGTRTHTEGMIIALEFEGIVGYGEVFMPPYYPENQETMSAFFEKVDVNKMMSIGEQNRRIEYVNSLSQGDTGAKAALDIAIHDLDGKRGGLSVAKSYCADESESEIHTSFTIGIDTIETMVRKAKEAAGFKFLKIKLKGQNDIEVIEAIRKITDQLLFVDANQGWDDVDFAIRTSARLVELGVGLIEQPFPKGQAKKAGALKANCAVPIVADEDVQTVDDIEGLAEFYDGINIKLMKAGGIQAANEMIFVARENGLKILLGCMTESSIGISAAAQIAHLADWCDLDGNLLIKNDTCTGVETIKGELILNDAPGIGITDDLALKSMFETDL